jgi:hypothetical protein
MAKMSKAQQQKYAEQLKKEMLKDVTGSGMKKKIPTRKRVSKKRLVPMKHEAYFNMVAGVLKKVLEDPEMKMPGTPWHPETAMKQAFKIISDRGADDKKQLTNFYNSCFQNKDTLLERLYVRVTQLKQEEKEK